MSSPLPLQSDAGPAAVPQLRSRDGDSFYGRTDQDEIDTRNEISQKTG